MKQTIIPEKVVKIAKFIQDHPDQQVVIVHKRQWGERAARALAKGEQILPADPSAIAPSQQ